MLLLFVARALGLVGWVQNGVARVDLSAKGSPMFAVRYAVLGSKQESLAWLKRRTSLPAMDIACESVAELVRAGWSALLRVGGCGCAAFVAQTFSLSLAGLEDL
jgi:hypothetical protein